MRELVDAALELEDDLGVTTVGAAPDGAVGERADGNVDGVLLVDGAEGRGGLVLPGTEGPLPLRPLTPLLFASSTSISSFGIVATFVRNIFSSV